MLMNRYSAGASDESSLVVSDVRSRTLHIITSPSDDYASSHFFANVKSLTTDVY